ncbi:hypothetical protein RCL_jg692.t1 [Rhizophagus clarus]|uniref:Uncharacterized protein n=1 Tax=Rhizophagus clarus TaxID=94130 RepID=A0A8H3QP53_9GLOM|nr:hypothetical protein RCL_jg692.t1 [Rhizophagus clarus]
MVCLMISNFTNELMIKDELYRRRIMFKILKFVLRTACYKKIAELNFRVIVRVSIDACSGRDRRVIYTTE